MKIYPVVVLAGFLLACGQSHTPEKNDSAAGTNVAISGVTDVRPLRPNIEYTPWDGGLYDAVYWKDKRGENIVVVSGEAQYFWEQNRPELKGKLSKDQDPETYSEVTELFARHYTLAKGEAKWKLYYQYEDRLFGCCDVYMQYQPSTLMVLDPDSSGTGDVVFMYHTTEGTGKIDSTWDGHLVLLKDSMEYRSSGASGISTISDYRIASDTSAYNDILSKMWMKNVDEWRKELRTPDTLTSTPDDIRVDRAN